VTIAVRHAIICKASADIGLRRRLNATSLPAYRTTATNASSQHGSTRIWRLHVGAAVCSLHPEVAQALLSAASASNRCCYCGNTAGTAGSSVLLSYLYLTQPDHASGASDDYRTADSSTQAAREHNGRRSHLVQVIAFLHSESCSLPCVHPDSPLAEPQPAAATTTTAATPSSFTGLERIKLWCATCYRGVLAVCRADSASACCLPQHALRHDHTSLSIVRRICL
jgi:hypothetical protein